MPVYDLIFSLWVTTAMDLYLFNSIFSLAFCNYTGDSAKDLTAGSFFLLSQSYFKYSSVCLVAAKFNYPFPSEIDFSFYNNAFLSY